MQQAATLIAPDHSQYFPAISSKAAMFVLTPENTNCWLRCVWKTAVLCHSLQQLKASSGHVCLSPQSPSSAIWSWGRWQAKVTDVLSIEDYKLYVSDIVHSLQINNWIKPCFSVLHLGLDLRGNWTVGGSRISEFKLCKPGLRQLGVLLSSSNFVLK